MTAPKINRSSFSQNYFFIFKKIQKYLALQKIKNLKPLLKKLVKKDRSIGQLWLE